jgi:hypothetical protein
VGRRSVSLRSSNDMHALKIAIDVVWIIFWVYWLASAFGVKECSASDRGVQANAWAMRAS